MITETLKATVPTRSVCYVDGILRMLASNLAGPVNIGNPDERSILDIARDVIAATGSRSAITFIGRSADDPGCAAALGRRRSDR
jgi:dTDP-glucose 4,6-dehydratase